MVNQFHAPLFIKAKWSALRGFKGRCCDAFWPPPQRFFCQQITVSVCCQPTDHLGGQAWHSVLWQNPHTFLRNPPSLPFSSLQSSAGSEPQNAPGAVTTDEERCCWGGRKIPLPFRGNERSGARYHWENYSPCFLPWHQRRADMQGARQRGEQVEDWKPGAGRWWGSNELREMTASEGLRDALRWESIESQHWCLELVLCGRRWGGCLKTCPHIAALHTVLFTSLSCSWFSADRDFRMSCHFLQVVSL